VGYVHDYGVASIEEDVADQSGGPEREAIESAVCGPVDSKKATGAGKQASPTHTAPFTGAPTNRAYLSHACTIITLE
jgi:hypothetical protein